MPKFEKHIFICTNQRPEGHAKGSCNPTGGAELHHAFKAGLAKRGLKGKVRANKAGCLDQCEHGPTVVVYPQAIWYGRVTVEDVDEIIDQHIARDTIVERLVIPDTCLNAESCPHKPRN
jgi:(2Fe-2S) ferredoxin